MRYSAYFVCSFVCLAATTTADDNDNGGKLPERPAVLILAFGGISARYVDLWMPLTTSARSEFVHTEELVPVFPTKSTVNLFSVATGLYAEDHKVFDNRLYDDPLGRKTEYYDENLTPVWIQNQIYGGHSGVLNWPGGRQAYGGRTPTHQIRKEDGGKNALDVMIGWLQDKQYPANLVMAYFDQIDKANHMRGSEYTAFGSQIMVNVDKWIKKCIETLDSIGMKNKINLIILGSQGAFTTSHKNGINLFYILNNERLDPPRGMPRLPEIPINCMGANAVVYPPPGEFWDVYNTLHLYSRVFIELQEERVYRIYTQDQIPDKWHLKKLPVFRGAIFVVAEPLHFFWSKYLLDLLAPTIDARPLIRKNQIQDINYFEIGMDGYNNDEHAMLSFFMARGPDFLSGKSSSFSTIDLYPLIIELLGFSERLPEVRMNVAVRSMLRSRIPKPTVQPKQFPDIRDEAGVKGGDVQSNNSYVQTFYETVSSVIKKAFKPIH